MLHTGSDEIHFQKPLVYQEINGTRQEIPGHYVMQSKDQVGFRVAAYDPTRPLVIDPVMVYSTYLGGSGYDLALGIAVDTSGNAYVTGQTNSTNFPTAIPLQPTIGSSYDYDAFVTKLNAEGSALVYSTYLGGSDDEWGRRIAVDASGMGCPNRL